MKQENYITRVLVADDNHHLTHAADVDIMDRVITDKVFLSVNDAPENWREISDEEAQLIIAEQQTIADNHDAKKDAELAIAE